MSPEPDFETLCLPLRQTLYSKAMQLAREPQAAQDLVQDTMLHGFLAWKTFRVAEGEDPHDRASAWMHRILTNHFITGCRSRQLRATLMVENYPEILEMTMAGTDGRTGVADTHEEGSAPVVVSDPQPSQRLSGAVQRALATLEPEAVDVVIRADLRGESYREISEEIGVSIGTIKSRLHRARKRLAEALGRPLAPGLSL